MSDIFEELKELKDLKARKAANTKAKDNVSKTVTDSAINELDEKFTWHSKVSNFAIYVLGVCLFILSSLTLYGYTRLEDKIANESQFASQRIDNFLQMSTTRLDEQSRFIAQSINEERHLNTERLDSFANKDIKQNLTK